jgi:hypothetical protein
MKVLVYVWKCSSANSSNGSNLKPTSEQNTGKFTDINSKKHRCGGTKKYNIYDENVHLIWGLIFPFSLNLDNFPIDDKIVFKTYVVTLTCSAIW